MFDTRPLEIPFDARRRAELRAERRRGTLGPRYRRVDSLGCVAALVAVGLVLSGVVAAALALGRRSAAASGDAPSWLLGCFGLVFTWLLVVVIAWWVLRNRYGSDEWLQLADFARANAMTLRRGVDYDPTPQAPELAWRAGSGAVNCLQGPAGARFAWAGTIWLGDPRTSLDSPSRGKIITGAALIRGLDAGTAAITGPAADPRILDRLLRDYSPGQDRPPVLWLQEPSRWQQSNLEAVVLPALQRWPGAVVVCLGVDFLVIFDFDFVQPATWHALDGLIVELNTAAQ